MAHDPHRIARQRVRHRLAVATWCGWAGSILALLGILPWLVLWTIDDMPQRDRPYGWLLDRLLPAGGYSLLALAACFAIVACIAWFGARRAAKDGTQTAGG